MENSLGCAPRWRPFCPFSIELERIEAFCAKEHQKILSRSGSKVLGLSGTRKNLRFPSWISVKIGGQTMMEIEDFFEYLTSRGPLNHFYLIFFGVLWRKMLLFFPIRSKMDSTGALVVRNRVSFPSEYFFSLKLQYPAQTQPVSQISTLIPSRIRPSLQKSSSFLI